MFNGSQNSKMQIVYTVALPTSELVLDESEVEGSFEVQLPASQTRPSLSDIKNSWPFEGGFHFRCKVQPKNEPFVWFDLVNDSDFLHVSDGVATVRALPLSHINGTISTPFEDDTQQLDSDEVANLMAAKRGPMSVQQYPLSAVNSEAAASSSMATGFARMAQFTSSIWGSKDSTAGSGNNTPTVPSGTAAPAEEGSFWSDSPVPPSTSGGPYASTQAQEEGGDAYVEGNGDYMYEDGSGGQQWQEDAGMGVGEGAQQGGEDIDPDLQYRYEDGSRSGAAVVDLDKEVAAAAMAAKEKASQLASKAKAGLSSFLGKAQKALDKAADRMQGGQGH